MSLILDKTVISAALVSDEKIVQCITLVDSFSGQIMLCCYEGA